MARSRGATLFGFRFKNTKLTLHTLPPLLCVSPLQSAPLGPSSTIFCWPCWPTRSQLSGRGLRGCMQILIHIPTRPLSASTIFGKCTRSLLWLRAAWAGGQDTGDGKDRCLVKGFGFSYWQLTANGRYACHLLLSDPSPASSSFCYLAKILMMLPKSKVKWLGGGTTTTPPCGLLP